MLQRAKVTMNDSQRFDAWVLKDERWNGWAIPCFDKENADKVAKEIGLIYDQETDTYTESQETIGGGDIDDAESWTGYFDEELGVHVYAIGARSYIWDIYDDTEMRIALDDFKQATRKLAEVWENFDGDIIADYPQCLPSFDEFEYEVRLMEVK